ncbi:hypothetical protein EV188_1011206 [Actinomycetospora succinea]|uniref:Uncharacterized protein n=1 Tax=Actinomycetospora succinea TaxID=663603 RepID=A0A4R6VTF7_9PSEU|nr:hypothetical protein [Actinomycetospora succinea]TDQ65954.1 hypothetical protein EV188_1011206 [Actinomycetospora succinea]
MTGDARAALRAFVRAHHPDVGGDPVAFREGLATHRAATRYPAPDDPRFDAPIVVVPDGRIARLGRFGRRLARRYDPRRGTARVL